jgi:hypothetical protein
MAVQLHADSWLARYSIIQPSVSIVGPFNIDITESSSSNNMLAIYKGVTVAVQFIDHDIDLNRHDLVELNNVRMIQFVFIDCKGSSAH